MMTISVQTAPMRSFHLAALRRRVAPAFATSSFVTALGEGVRGGCAAEAAGVAVSLRLMLLPPFQDERGDQEAGRRGR